MAKKSIEEWAEKIAELYEEFKKDHPNANIVMGISTPQEDSEDEIDIIQLIDTADEFVFTAMLTYLQMYYSAYIYDEVDEMDFPEDAKFIDFWSNPFSQN